MTKLTLKALLVALPLFAFVSAANAEPVALDKAPEAVQKAVKAAAGTVEVKEVESTKAADGKVSFAAKIGDKTVTFDAEGKEVK